MNALKEKLERLIVRFQENIEKKSNKNYRTYHSRQKKLNYRIMSNRIFWDLKT